jgi:hypothetical protein
MYKVTTVFEKPNGDIQYYLATQPELRTEFSIFLSESTEILTLNVVDESATRQISEAYYADETMFNVFITRFNQQFPTFFADRDSYHGSVGVTTTRTAATV